MTGRQFQRHIWRAGSSRRGELIDASTTSSIRSWQWPLRDVHLARYVAARIVSLAGSAITFVAMPVLVYGLTGSATWTSLVVAAEGVPSLLLGLWAGAVADHVDRRRVMVGCDLMAAGILATVPIAAWLDVLTAPHVLVAALLTRIVFVFFDAANQGALPSLVGRDRLPSVNALVFGTGTAVEIVAPLVAGALIVIVSPASVLAIDVVTFVASAALIRGIARPLGGGRTHPPGVGVRAIGQGLRFLLGHDVVRFLIVIGALVAFSAGSLMASLVVWADQALGVGEGDGRLGAFFAAWGLGAVLGSAVVPRVARRYGGVRTVVRVLPAAAVTGLLIPLAHGWIAGVLAIAAWSAAYMVVVTASVTTRQQVTPDALMSRVMAAGRMTTFGLGYPLGALVVGALASTTTIAVAIAVCQLSLVAAATVAWTCPLRRAGQAVAMAAGPNERLSGPGPDGRRTADAPP